MAKGRLFYRAVPPAELPAYRQAVKRAKGRLLALAAGDVVGTLATVGLNCHGANPARAYDRETAEYIWAQLVARWGVGDLGEK
jgi:hypothetical protein